MVGIHAGDNRHLTRRRKDHHGYDPDATRKMAQNQMKAAIILIAWMVAVLASIWVKPHYNMEQIVGLSLLLLCGLGGGFFVAVRYLLACRFTK